MPADFCRCFQRRTTRRRPSLRSSALPSSSSSSSSSSFFSFCLLLSLPPDPESLCLRERWSLWQKKPSQARPKLKQSVKLPFRLSLRIDDDAFGRSCYLKILRIRNAPMHANPKSSRHRLQEMHKNLSHGARASSTLARSSQMAPQSARADDAVTRK